MECLTRRVDGRVAILTMNRPQVKNAVNAQLAMALEAALDWAEAEADVWTIVLTGAGDAFCAGADLNEVSAGGRAGFETERGGFAGVVRRERVKPLIAAVEGPAVAGGCEIALACDLIVASEGARFALPEVKRSLVAVAGGLDRLPQAIPLKVAMEMALTGDPITAARAAELGMVNVLAASGQALSQALGLAARVNACAPLAVRATRRAVIDSLRVDQHEAWSLADRALESVQQTADYLEGPRAFLEKRAPQWHGR